MVAVSIVNCLQVSQPCAVNHNVCHFTCYRFSRVVVMGQIDHARSSVLLEGGIIIIHVVTVSVYVYGLLENQIGSSFWRIFTLMSCFKASCGIN